MLLCNKSISPINEDKKITANILVMTVLSLSVGTTIAVSNFTTANHVLAQTLISAGRMHLDEGIKVLKTRNIRGAMMHLNIADKILGRGR